MRQTVAASIYLLAGALTLLLSSPASALWFDDGNQMTNSPTFTQFLSRTIPDGQDGMIALTSRVDPTFYTTEIYAHRIDAEGNVVWAPGGVRLASSGGEGQNLRAAVPDGTGGVIGVWTSSKLGTLRAGRIDGSGTLLWITIVSQDGFVDRAAAVPDGSGGIVMGWYDFTFATGIDVFAQRLDGAGVKQWGTDGVVVCDALDDQLDVEIVSLGNAETVLTWVDERSAKDIYGQRLTAAGAPVWTANGNPIHQQTNTIFNEDLVSDGSGGVLSCARWFDGVDDFLLVQKVDGNGQSLWPATTVLTDAPDQQVSASIMSDGQGGVIGVWRDSRDLGFGSGEIYAQRLNVQGLPAWGIDDLLVSLPLTNTSPPSLMATPNGPVIAWSDSRNGNADVFAQRLDLRGGALWDTSGKLICGTPATQGGPQGVTTSGDAFLVGFFDNRNTADDVYAQRFEGRNGFIGLAEPRITSVSDVAADQGGFVAVNWLASRDDTLPDEDVLSYSVWRAVDALPKGAAELPVLTGDDLPAFLDGPVLMKSSGFFWEWVASQEALQIPGYALNARTTANGILNYFQVVAHYATGESTISAPDSGTSIDNLPPGPPQNLVLTPLSVLKWDANLEPDLSYYTVYGSNSPTLDASATLLGETIEISFGIPPTAYAYYFVTATDFSSNEGDAGSLLVPTASDLPIQKASLGVYPNPFNPTTTLRYSIPRDARVSLVVYDLAGRVVDVLLQDQAHEAGEHRAVYQPQAASGVYFVRMTVDGVDRALEKIVLVR